MKRATLYLAVIALLTMAVGPLSAAPLLFTGSYDQSRWSTVRTNSDGSVITTAAPGQITVIGSNNGSFDPGTTDYTVTVAGNGTISFHWDYSTADDSPRFDPFGIILNGDFSQISEDFGPSSQSGNADVLVSFGDTFGFRVHSVDNIFGSAQAVISLFDGPIGGPNQGEYVVFNSFELGDGYRTFAGLPVAGPLSSGPQIIFGVGFTPRVSVRLTRIQLAASLVDGPDELRAVVATGGSGKPGTVLETFNFSNAMGPLGIANPLLVGESTNHPFLQAGKPYFLLLYPGDPATSAVWNTRTKPATNSGVASEDGGATFFPAHFEIPVARIFGEAAVAEAPEPGTLALWSLLSLIGAAFAGRQWRRRL